MAEESRLQTSADGRVKGRRRNWIRNLRSSRRKVNGATETLVLANEEDTPSEEKRQFQEELKIRLVHLQPRSISGDTIQCKLTSQTLIADTYEALSYEWGPIFPELFVDMDGVEFPVRENLWWALWHLRLEDRPRTMWIDALCINQKDTEERNYQVSRMDYIYHSASQCIAWVGKEEIGPGLEIDDCKLAIEFLDRINSHDADASSSITLSTQAEMELNSLELLCYRRYWTRLWIIQEVLLSKSVRIQCGPKSIPWTALTFLFDNLKARVHASYQFSITYSPPFRLSRAWSLTVKRGIGGSPPALADLVILFKDSQCEDPRDTIFGLLGLTQNCCRDEVPADYSTTPENLCVTLLLHHMAYHLNLEDPSPDTTADIRDICLTVTSNPKVTQDLQDSIASLSIRARHATTPAFAEFQAQRGQVILTLSAIDLRNTMRRSKCSDTKTHRLSLADKTSYFSRVRQLDTQLLDLRAIVVENLQKRFESSVAEPFTNDPKWKRQRDSLKNIDIAIPPQARLTHIFLTDTGYSGITTADTKLGDAGSSNHEYDFKVTFEREILRGGTGFFRPYKSRPRHTYGICLDSDTTFHELLSWVQ